jgi:hypothetical protein
LIYFTRVGREINLKNPQFGLIFELKVDVCNPIVQESMLKDMIMKVVANQKTHTLTIVVGIVG